MEKIKTSHKLLIEEIKILEKMFKDLPYKIEGNKKSIKKLAEKLEKEVGLEKKKPVDSLWGIKIYLDPMLPDNEIKLVSNKNIVTINIEDV